MTPVVASMVSRFLDENFHDTQRTKAALVHYFTDDGQIPAEKVAVLERVVSGAIREFDDFARFYELLNEGDFERAGWCLAFSAVAGMERAAVRALLADWQSAGDLMAWIVGQFPFVAEAVTLPMLDGFLRGFLDVAIDHAANMQPMTLTPWCAEITSLRGLVANDGLMGSRHA